MTLTAPERMLLDACAGRIEAIPAMAWAGIVQLAEQHDVAPMVAWSLLRQNKKAEKPHCEEWASETVARGLIHQELVAAEVASVLSALDATPALLFKGPSISRRWYPRGARIDRDIDIHVNLEDYVPAKTAIERLGYVILPVENERLQLLQTKDVGFARVDDRGNSWTVELHVRFTEPGAPDLDADVVWKCASPLEIGGRAVSVPSGEHTLLLLALNLRKHRFARLKTVVDIGRLVGATPESLDWEVVHRDAHRAGYCGLVRHAVSLSTGMMGMPHDGGPGHTRRRAEDPEDRFWGGCRREHTWFSPAARVLPKVATADTVFGELREDDRSKSISGLIPFISLDKPAASLHLAYARLTLAPEMASYYRIQGEPGSAGYGSRISYWWDVARRLGRAATVLFWRRGQQTHTQRVRT